MMNKCKICGKEYLRGESVDIGIGSIQISANEPDCDCEYVEWLIKQQDE